jgi:hypothetical protein
MAEPHGTEQSPITKSARAQLARVFREAAYLNPFGHQAERVRGRTD